MFYGLLERLSEFCTLTIFQRREAGIQCKHVKLRPNGKLLNEDRLATKTPCTSLLFVISNQHNYTALFIEVNKYSIYTILYQIFLQLQLQFPYTYNYSLYYSIGL